MSRQDLHEWVTYSPVTQARYREFSLGSYEVLIGCWPLSWAIGFMVGHQEFSISLGPLGLHVY